MYSLVDLLNCQNNLAEDFNFVLRAMMVDHLFAKISKLTKL